MIEGDIETIADVIVVTMKDALKPLHADIEALKAEIAELKVLLALSDGAKS